jgi:hypothetical protein
MNFCGNCGVPVAGQAAETATRVYEPPYYDAPPRRDDGLVTVIKVFLILGCISFGALLIPLAWCIPMTVSIFRKLDSGEPIGTGLKVCTLLFVNLIAGILLLCLPE